MATDIPDFVSQTKGELEGKELTCGELSDVTVNKNDMEIPKESKNGVHELIDKKEPEEKNGTHCTVSSTEDQEESDTAVCKKTGDAQVQDAGSYAEEEIPFVAKTTEERIKEAEDESESAKSTGSADIEKESANNDAPDQEMHTPPQMNGENGMSNTSEVENCSENGKLEMSKHENLSNRIIEEDKSENETTVNEASKEAIMEQEESAKNFEGSLNERVETEKASVEFEAEGDSHVSDAAEGQSISTPTENNIISVEDGENPISAPEFTAKDTSERPCPETNQTNLEEEINEEENQSTKPIKEQASAKQLVGEIEKGDESEINKEQTMEEESCSRELHMIAAADENRETVNKVTALDENPSVMDKSKVAEDLNRESEAPPMGEELVEEIQVIEKPVDISSSEDEIIKEKIEEMEDCDDKTDIASSEVTEESILGEAKLNDELVKALDTSSEAKGQDTVKTADTRQLESEVDSIKLEETSSIVSDLPTHEHDEANNAGISEEKSFEVVQKETPDSVSETQVQGAEEIDETVTAETVGESDTDEIDQNIRDGPEALSEPIDQGVETVSKDEIAPSPTVKAEKVEEEQLQVSSYALPSNDEDGETTTTVEQTEDGCKNNNNTEDDTNEVEEQILQGESEQINQFVEATSKDENAPCPTLEPEKIKEQLQVSSSVVLTSEEDGETTTTVEKTADGCTMKDDTEVDNLKLEETAGVVSQTLSTTCESADNAIVEKSDADIAKFEETKTLEAVSEPEGTGFEDIHENETSPTEAITDARKAEEEIKATDKISPQGAENGTTIEKIEDESTQKVEKEVDDIKLEEATVGLSEFPTTENEKEERVNKVTDLDQTRTQGLQVTASDNPTEMNQLKVAEDLNQEMEDAIKKEEIEETEECDDKTDIAPAVVAELSLNDVPLKAPDTSSEARGPGTAKTGGTTQEDAEVDNMKLEETSSMVSHLRTHEQEKADNVCIDKEKPAAIDFEVEENKIPDAVSESKVQGAEEVDDTVTSLTLEETSTNEIKEQVGDAHEELFEPVTQGVKSDGTDEIAPGQTLQAEKIEDQLQVSSTDLLSNKEDGEAMATVEKTDDGCIKKDDTEVDSSEIEDTSDALSEPLNQGVEVTCKDDNAHSLTPPCEKIEEQLVRTYEIAELTRDSSEALYEPGNQGVEAASNDDISPGLTLRAENIEEPLQVSSATEVSNEEDGKTKITIEQTEDGCKKREDIEVDTNGIEEQSGEASEAFYKPINQGVEAYGNDEIALALTTQANETEDQLQVSSSVVPSNEKYGETATANENTEDGCTKKDDTKVDNGNLEETPGLVSQPLSTTYESANNAVVEGSDADTVKVEETKSLEAVYEPEDPGFEEIHESQKSPMVEVVETGTTIEKIEDEDLSKASATVEKMESEVDNIKLEEATAVLSQFLITENEDLSKASATVEKAEANEFGVEVEEAKTSNTTSESEPHGAAEESKKIEEIQLKEKVADSFDAGAKVAYSFDAGATDKPCLHDEGLREIDVSNFDLTAENDSQNPLPEQERRSLEEDSVKPQECILEAKYADYASEPERTPFHCSSEDTSKDEKAIALRNSNEDSDNLPPPHPTIKELSTEEGEAIYEEDTSLEKITEENEVTRISHPMPPHEETVTESNQEDKLLDSPEREDETIAEPYEGEKSATLDTQSDEIPHEELFDKQTAASIVGEKSIQIENHKKDEDPIELSANGNESSLVEPVIHTATTGNGDDESPHLNENPNVSSDCKDIEVSHEKTVTNHEITKDAKELEKGVKSGEEKKSGEECQETTEKSIVMDSDKTSRKKSHNILSGVGSKVKHSIAKVKKAITGKSSHPKTSSPPREEKNES